MAYWRDSFIRRRRYQSSRNVSSNLSKSRKFVAIACFGFAFFGIVPVGLWTVVNLENRFPGVMPPPVHSAQPLSPALAAPAMHRRGKTRSVDRYSQDSRKKQECPATREMSLIIK